MTMWLYQMNEKMWSPQQCRAELCSKRKIDWPVHKVTGGEPAVGDTVVLYYSRTGASDPGFYGWGVITRLKGKKAPRIEYVPCDPTNTLMMIPWGTPEAHALADKIRGAMKQGTMFRIDDEYRSAVRFGIRTWVNGSGSSQSSD